MKEAAVTLAQDGTILYCNQSHVELVGRPSEQIVGRSVFELVLERPRLERMMTVDGAGGESAELSIVTADGGVAPVNVSIVELSVEDGAERMLCGIVTDLSHAHARARELSDANTRLAAEIAERTKAEQSLAIALEAADMGSWDPSLNGDGSSRTARHAIFGQADPAAHWGLDEMLAHFTPEDREAVRGAFEAAAATGRVEFEKRIRRAGDDALRWVHVKGRTFHGDQGPERIAGVVVDVTERRLIDEQLRQGQKMEAIGQLTGGIAHDFNNLLMIIGGSLEALARRVSLDDRVQRLLDAARLGVARGAKLNEQLLAFARRREMHDEAICINDLLPDFETLLDRALGEQMRVRVRRDPALWWCRTDPHQLETAILNLAINARDAMEGDGTLGLDTENRTLSEAEAARWETRPGDYVVVSVTDTGPGMDAELIGRVFEPFFTTKGPGKGTGLGLSQVYGFAKQSGGFVAIDRTVGQGATVAIHLPRVDGEGSGRAAVEPVAALGRANGVVLPVEDDPDVRGASRAMLEELGYSVLEAASGREALEALKAGRRIDIVFTDVIMSTGMTGIELARTIRADQPPTPVLLTSGYTAQKHVAVAANRDLPLLRKPYTMNELADGLDRTIDEAAQR